MVDASRFPAPTSGLLDSRAGSHAWYDCYALPAAGLLTAIAGVSAVRASALMGALGIGLPDYFCR